jgi:purine-binding chemotaxis protein CheW
MSTPITSVAHYITLQLGNELFAIDVVQVREILELAQVTKVPTAPAYMRGVVNVRGRAIPVVDLRAKFGLLPIADTLMSRVVVMEIDLGGELCVVGGLADSVHEVIEIEPSQVSAPPELASRWRTELIRGMHRRGDQFLIILDMAAVFSAADCSLLQGAHTGEPVAAGR